MAVKTISKNGKRVPAESKGKVQKKGQERAKAKAKEPDKHPPKPGRDISGGTSKASASSAGPALPKTPVNEPTPLLRLTVPTDIGKVCHKDGVAGQQAVAILRDHTSDDHVFLTATDGRILAIVRADWERVGNVEGAGLHAGWLRREMATTAGGDGRTLRLTKGTAETLFGDGLKWVDDNEGWFLEVPDGGQFPPVQDLMPQANPVGWTCVRVRASAISKLAAALNSAETDDRDAITLMVHEDADGGVTRPVIVVGNRGIGLMLPAPQNTDGSITTYRSMLKAFQHGRPRGSKAVDPERAMNPAPLDQAQQFPSSTPPETVVDKETGEVREVHRDPTGTADYTLTTPIIPDADDDDDGKDAPTSPIKVAEMTLSAETKAALANVGIITVKDVADYIEGGGALGALVDSFSERKRLLDCAKPFLPEPADSAA